MMCRSISVVERDAIEIDVIVAIRKASEVSGRLAETNAIAARSEGARGHLHRFAKIGDRRSEVLNERLCDLGTRRACIEQRIHGSQRGRNGTDRIGLNDNLLRNIADGEHDSDFLILSGSELHRSAIDAKAGGRYLDSVTAGRKAADREMALIVGLGSANVGGGLILHVDGRSLKHATFGIGDSSRQTDAS